MNKLTSRGKLHRQLRFETLGTRQMLAADVVELAVLDDDLEVSFSDAKLFTSVDNGFVFAATSPGFGEELWRFDDSTQRSQRITDAVPGANASQIFGMTAIGNRVFFAVASDDGASLFVTDGTEDGTVRLFKSTERSRWVGIDTFQAVGSTLYFVAAYGGQRHLWATDGTVLATRVITEFGSSDIPLWVSTVVATESSLLVSDNQSRLWIIDGGQSQPRAPLALVEASLPNSTVASFYATSKDYYLHIISRPDGNYIEANVTHQLFRVDPVTSNGELVYEKRGSGKVEFGTAAGENFWFAVSSATANLSLWRAEPNGLAAFVFDTRLLLGTPFSTALSTVIEDFDGQWIASVPDVTTSRLVMSTTAGEIVELPQTAYHLGGHVPVISYQYSRETLLNVDDKVYFYARNEATGDDSSALFELTLGNSIARELVIDGTRYRTPQPSVVGKRIIYDDQPGDPSVNKINAYDTVSGEETQLVSESHLAVTPRNFEIVAVMGDLTFLANRVISSSPQLWTVDSRSNLAIELKLSVGTDRQVKHLSNFQVIGDQVLFSVGTSGLAGQPGTSQTETWVTQGTALTTKVIDNTSIQIIGVDPWAASIEFDGAFYFIGTNRRFEQHVYRRVVSGQVEKIQLGDSDASANNAMTFRQHDNQLLVTLPATSAGGDGIFLIDSRTTIAKRFAFDDHAAIVERNGTLFQLNDEWHFLAVQPETSFIQLWMYDLETSTATLVKTTDQAARRIYHAIAFENRLYISTELIRQRPNGSITEFVLLSFDRESGLVSEIGKEVFGNNVDYLRLVDRPSNSLIVEVNDRVDGFSVWAIDGALQEPFLLRHVMPLWYRPRFMPLATQATPTSATVFFNFSFDDATGNEFWITDGTYNGTSVLVDFQPGSGDWVIQDHFVSESDLYVVGRRSDNRLALVRLSNIVADSSPDIVRFALQENSAADSFVGRLSTASSPEGSFWRYALVDANDSFQINPLSGVIEVKDPSRLDFESIRVHEFSLRIDQVSSVTNEVISSSVKRVVVELVNVNEAPYLVNENGERVDSLPEFVVSDDIKPGDRIGRLRFFDPEGDSITVVDTSHFSAFKIDSAGNIIARDPAHYQTSTGQSRFFPLRFDVKDRFLQNGFGAAKRSYWLSNAVRFFGVNEPPVQFGDYQDATVLAGATSVIDLSAVTWFDPEREEVAVSAAFADGTPLPSWLIFDPVQNRLTASPWNAESGSHVIKMTATDATGLKSEAQFVLVVDHNSAPWQNWRLAADANGDGVVQPIDALLIINFLARNRNHRVDTNVWHRDAFFDVSGDNIVSPLDALLVINFISRRRRSGGEGELFASEPDEIKTAQLKDSAISSWDMFDDVRKNADKRRRTLE